MTFSVQEILDNLQINNADKPDISDPQKTMHKIDKRHRLRILVGEIKQDSLTLLAQGKLIKINTLLNVSESGLSFLVNNPMDVSEKIAIAYADAQVKVEVFGRVAWCSRIQPAESPEGEHTDKYMVGIELFSPMMLYALLPKS